MKAGMLLLILHDVVEGLVRLNVLSIDGDFSVDIQKDLQVAAMIEQVLKSRGVMIDSNIDKVIQALPLFLGLIK